MDIPPQNEEQTQETTEQIEASTNEVVELNQDDDNLENKIEYVNFKELVQRDITDVNIETKRKVNETKNNIAGFINFCNKESKSDVPTTHDKETKLHPAAENIIRQGIYEVKEKAKTDLQVIQLYDKSLTNEIQDHIKRDVIDKNITTIKKKTKTDFQNTLENTESLVVETKSTIENFVNTISENATNVENNENLTNIEIWQKMKKKAQRDFLDTKERTHKQSSKAMYRIQENMSMFLTNPGRKSEAELEAEEFVKENIIDISDKIKEDIIKQKLNFSKVVEEAKDNVGLNLIFSKNSDSEGGESGKNKLRRLYHKTKSDFKEVNDKIQENVTTLNEQIMEFSNETNVDNENIPDVLSNFPETAQTDFKETNVKIREDISDLKSKIAHGVAIKENTDTNDRQKEFSRVVENSLNEFHDMAKNDFQETNEKVMDKVEIAKSKIDQSVNKLKDHLFFNRF